MGTPKLLTFVLITVGVTYLTVLSLDYLATNDHAEMARIFADKFPRQDGISIDAERHLLRKLLDARAVKVITTRPASYHLRVVGIIIGCLFTLGVHRIFTVDSSIEQFDALRRDYLADLHNVRQSPDHAAERQLRLQYLRDYCALSISCLFDFLQSSYRKRRR